MKLKVGITGQSGFIGKHLYNTLGLHPDLFERVFFKREYFDDEDLLDSFVSKCEVIIHLAGINRHSDPNEVYRGNIEISNKLHSALVRTRSQSHVLFASSTQEERENSYGRAKKEARQLFANWASMSGTKFTGLIIPNVFGPFCSPFYNSVVATFCYELWRKECPRIDLDVDLKLIYISELVAEIIEALRLGKDEILIIQHTYEIKVSELLSMLSSYYQDYVVKGLIPSLNTSFEVNLFNTFRSYLDLNNFFPIKLTKNVDIRGTFVEIIKLNVGGQVSFSMTLPGIVRGNHFHTRKIERFAVIHGKALIQLRQIGSLIVFDFYLDGDDPAFIDMPIWFTHNIKNIGKEELYTIFWINEFYNPIDPDTFLETV